MTRLPTIDLTSATGEARDLLAQVRATFGLVPNMTKVMANSPALLEGYLALNAALSRGSFDAGTRELVAIAVAEANGCGYCLSAHTYIGATVARVDAEELERARDAASSDSRTDAVLRLADAIVRRRGHLDDADLEAARSAGLTDGDIAETVGHVALNVLTNLLNLTADVDNDWPALAPRNAAA